MKITELDLEANGKMYFCKQANEVVEVINGELIGVKTKFNLGDIYSIHSLLNMYFEEYSKPKDPYERTVYKKYYYISSDNTVNVELDNEFNLDEKMFACANYFNNKNYAEYIAFKENLMRRMDKFAWEHNHRKIDWSDDNPGKYYLYYNYSSGKMEVDFCYRWRTFDTVYFSSEKVAKKALEEFEDDLIKVYTWNFDFK